MSKTASLLIFFLLGACLFTHAQELDQELKVIKDFESTMYAPDPLFDFASIGQPMLSPAQIRMDSMIHLPVNIPDVAVSVRPLAYEGPQRKSLYNGYLRADKGSLNPLAIRGGYVYAMDNYFAVEGSGMYDNWTEDQAARKFIKRSEGHLAFKYYPNQYTLATLRADGGYRQFGLYSFADLSDENRRDSHDLSRFGTSLSVESFRTGKGVLNYRLKTGFQRTAMTFPDVAENLVNVEAEISYQMMSDMFIFIEGDLEEVRQSIQQNMSAYRGMAGFQLNTNHVFGTVGLRYIRYNALSRWHPNMILRAEVNKELKIEVSTGHDVLTYGLGQLSDINPYIDFERSAFFMGYEKYYAVDSRYAGLGLKALSLGLNYHQYTDRPNFSILNSRAGLFQSSRVDYNQWTIRMNVQKDLSNHFEAGLEVHFNHYVDMTSPLFHLPRFDMSPFVAVNLLNRRLKFHVTGLFNEGRTIQVADGTMEDGGWRHDLSVELKYQILNRLNVYLNLDNAFDDDNQLWSGTPVFGRNVSGGIMIRI